MVVRAKVEAEEGIRETRQGVEGERLLMTRDDKANFSMSGAPCWRLWDTHYPRWLITASLGDPITVDFHPCW